MPQQAKRQNNKRNMPRKNLWLDFIIYAIVLAVLIWVGFTVKDNYYRDHLDWHSSYQGSLDDKIEAEALLIRDEIMLNATQTGTLRKAVDAGTRVNSGAVIAYIDTKEGKSYAITAPKSGIVQFAIDGLESFLGIDGYQNVDIEYLFSLIEQDNIISDSDEINIGKSFAAGDVIGKLADNLVDFYLAIYTKQFHELPANSKNLTVKLADNTEIKGRIEKKGELKEGQFYVLKVSATTETEHLPRYMQVSFIGSGVEGVIIPRSALVAQEDGSYKVFYRKKNAIAECTVELLGIRDDLAAVSGIAAGTDVVGCPQYARVGAKAFE